MQLKQSAKRLCFVCRQPKEIVPGVQVKGEPICVDCDGEL